MMQATWEGNWCQHGEYEDRQCDKCEIERLGRCNEQLSRSHAEVRNILERQNIELLAIVAYCRRYAPNVVAAAEGALMQQGSGEKPCDTH